MIRKAGLIVFLLLVLCLPLFPKFYVIIASYIGLYCLVAFGMVLLTGVTGLTSLGQAAFMGVGAYTTAYMTINWGWSPWATLPVALLMTIAVAALIGSVTLRMGGHFLPLATIAWGISLYFFFGSMEKLGGHTGIPDIKPLQAFGTAIIDERAFYYIIWGVVLAAMWITNNILDSRSGRVVRALKSNAPMAESFGASPFYLKSIVFTYSAVLACLAGWLYAHMQRYINPTPFGLAQGTEFLFMITIGGAAHIWGAILGATVVTTLKTVLQGILPALINKSGNFEVIVFGVMILGVLQWMRGGIWVYIDHLIPARPNRKIGAETLKNSGTKPASTGEVLLRVDAARKEFGGLVAVNDVSFEVRSGEIVGLIGPNGAGKSTMFNLISGYLPRTSGTITFTSQTISGLKPSQIARKGLNRTFQHVKLIHEMSVLENVMIGAYLRTSDGILSASLRLNRANEAAIRAEAAGKIRLVGLEDSMFTLSGSLPLGKQRIVEIARALCANPVLLLLDEPAAGLSYLEKKELAELLEKLRHEGMTLLIVEHDMDFLMNLVDRVVVMNFGAKLAEGLPEEIQHNPTVLEAYLGAE